jgi:hypothetical protein
MELSMKPFDTPLGDFSIDDLELTELRDYPRETYRDPARPDVEITRIEYQNADGQDFIVQVSSVNPEARQHYIETARLRARAFVRDEAGEEVLGGDGSPEFGAFYERLQTFFHDLRATGKSDLRLDRLQTMLEHRLRVTADDAQVKFRTLLGQLLDRWPNLDLPGFDDDDDDVGTDGLTRDEVEIPEDETVEIALRWRGNAEDEIVRRHFLRFMIDPELDTDPRTTDRPRRHIYDMPGTTVGTRIEAFVSETGGNIDVLLQGWLLHKWIPSDAPGLPPTPLYKWKKVDRQNTPDIPPKTYQVASSAATDYRLHIIAQKSATGQHQISTYDFSQGFWTGPTSKG